MRLEDRLRKEYLDWLIDIVCTNRYRSFEKLLTHLHTIQFTYTIRRDSNRAEDGKSMRHRFALTQPKVRDVELYLEGPCSVLEMMVALAVRCEDIMDDLRYGDRTAQWFWEMIVNLGLGEMTDALFDEGYVEDVISKFLRRRYSPDGKGGLFTIKNCKRDLTKVEIWYQLNWYLSDSFDF